MLKRLRNGIVTLGCVLIGLAALAMLIGGCVDTSQSQADNAAEEPPPAIEATAVPEDVSPSPAQPAQPAQPQAASDGADVVQEESVESVASELKLPGITAVNREEGYVDLKATVVLREGQLELVACLRDTKEHESIFAIEALPMHVHAALLAIGLDNGKPGQWLYDEETKEESVIPPSGPKVDVQVIYERDGQQYIEPIAKYVIDQNGNALPDKDFLFSGSYIAETRSGRTFYAANRSGVILSLVSFGDDVLSWPVPASTANQTLMWYANPDTVPPLGTEVTLRLSKSE